MIVGFATSDWALGHRDGNGHPTYGGAGWARIGLPARHLSGSFDVVEGTLAFYGRLGKFAVKTWSGKMKAVRRGKPVDEWVGDLVVPDVIVLQRWMQEDIARNIAKATRRGQVVVNDVDDHFWALDSRNQASRTTDPRTNPRENRNHYLRTISASSAVTVSTPYLADELRRLGVRSPVHVLENHVDVEAFDKVWEAKRAEREDLGPVIGWIGATPWRSGDLVILRGVLSAFVTSRDLRAFHGGHVEREGVPTFAGEVGLDPTQVKTKPMVPISRYPELFRFLDIGLVPLTERPFNRAKSWIKGIEYAAAGVPFVASALPEYRRLLTGYGIGRLAQRPKDWVSHWSKLLDPSLRRDEAEANRQAVKRLDIRQGIGQWRDLYLELLAAS